LDVIGGLTYMNPSSWLTAHPAFVLFDDVEDDPEMVQVGDLAPRRRRASLGAKVLRASVTLHRRLRPGGRGPDEDS
jgi:hypothetical protein